MTDTNSEAWRRETEARYVLSLPTLDERRQFLAKVEAKRGKPAADALRADMTWQHEGAK